MKKSLILLMLMSVNLQAAEPLIKNGNCPIGYWTNGGYCLPDSTMKDKVVIPKAKDSVVCPIGFYQNNNYCVKQETRR
jgi:hypothetical protein